MLTTTCKKAYLSIVVLGLIGALVGGSTPATASTLNTNMAISVNVVAACSGLTATPLTFPDIPSGSTSNVDANADVKFTCTNGTPWTLDADAGLHFDGIAGSRVMVSGGSNLRYNLYKDNFTTQWGTAMAFLGGTAITGTGTGSLETHNIQGRIPAGQGVSPGTYSDTVSVTFTF